MSEYDVGYGKPPKEHQFKKGQPAANPKGRPKGRKSKGILGKLNEKVIVGTKNGRRIKKPLREVLDHNVVKDAIAGDKHARTLIYRALEAEKAEAPAMDQGVPWRPPFPEHHDFDGARQKLKQILVDALAHIDEDVAEAVELGIFEMIGLRLRLADWVRDAAKARGALAQPALPKAA